jgi:hypothetical protein
MQPTSDRKFRILAAGGSFVIFCLLALSILLFDQNKNSIVLSFLLRDNSNMKCKNLNLSPGESLTEQVFDESQCFTFKGNLGQNLLIDADMQISLVQPPTAAQMFNGLTRINLLNESYQLNVRPKKDSSHKIVFTLSGQKLTGESISIEKRVGYNVTTSPSFARDQKLLNIVNSAVTYIQSRGHSSQSLSISLIDLNQSPCCAYASYQDQQPRFPASIPKLFWMVALYGQYQSGVLPEGTISEQDVYKMIQNSDNDPASKVLDQITQTTSGENLPSESLRAWLEKRSWVNRFFEAAGYRNINITQKNFPVPLLKMVMPLGRDLQIRQMNGKQGAPFRNFLTSQDAARLLYEIDTEQAISKVYSQKMKEYLRRDLRPEAWQHIQYNSIKGFLGEFLPVDTYFASKVGWTSDSRSDAAIISTPNGETRYILVIFSEGADFAEDWEVFPKASRLIYDQMVRQR